MATPLSALAPSQRKAHNQLYMLYGASPSAGKTTVCTTLGDGLHKRGLDVTVIAEQVVLDRLEFASVVRAFRHGDGDRSKPVCRQRAILSGSARMGSRAWGHDYGLDLPLFYGVVRGWGFV